MKIALVVAAARNRAIGLNNKMPWHLPEDLKYFKRVTMGKPVIMGRNTFESIGRPLPGRPNIVISRNADYKAEGITLVNSLDAALQAAAKLLPPGVDEVMVIGGAQIYAAALSLAQRVVVTVIHKDFEGDAFAPTLGAEWREVSRECHPAADGAPQALAFDFVTFER